MLMKPISPTRLPYWLQAPHARYLKDVIVRYVRPYFISYLHSPRTFLRPNTVSPLPLPRPRSYRYLGGEGRLSNRLWL